jgi:hypothetical protein
VNTSTTVHDGARVLGSPSSPTAGHADKNPRAGAIVDTDTALAASVPISEARSSPQASARVSALAASVPEASAPAVAADGERGETPGSRC